MSKRIERHMQERASDISVTLTQEEMYAAHYALTHYLDSESETLKPDLPADAIKHLHKVLYKLITAEPFEPPFG